MLIYDCLLCQKPLKHTPSWHHLFEKFPSTICERCEQEFERVETAKKTTALENEAATCLTHSLYHYNEPMKDYLHRYKFMHDTVLALVFRKQLYEALKHTIVVPIPMHPKKKKERTFSHIELLLKSAQIPYFDVLEKTTQETQSSKTREQRLASEQFFTLKREPNFNEIILFDDIVTTGTTLKHAKNLLEQAGVKRIQCITLITARAKK